MHRLPTRLAIWRMRMASLLLWINYLLFGAFLASLVIAFLGRNREKMDLLILMAAAFVASLVIQWLIAFHTKCPLCITPVLASKSCSKNSKAKTFLGSYRLRVANNVLLRNHFRCPYCSEPTELKVRPRRSRR